MSISAAMSNALSGLNAASRQAGAVSSNIANALNENYARREVALTARRVGSTGQGVQVTGVVRITDPVVTGDRRTAQAAAADRGTRAGALLRIEQALGSPEDAGSLTARIAAFDGALVAAASRPESEARLGAAADAASALAATLRRTTAEVQAVRKTADAGIAQDVARINAALEGVAHLNAQILNLSGGGRDASALMDQRQELIDGIAALVPLREIAREGGVVALYTTGGAGLLDGTRPARLEFAAAGVITAEMTLASGALSGLSLNGQPVATGDDGMFAGGAMAARFALRDDLMPRVQADLDALARDLIARFEAPGRDPTLTPGAAGLFTDEGAALDPALTRGLAGRITLNAAVDRDRGGAAWRLRDGLAAAAPGPSGASALLTALGAALSDPRVTAEGSMAGGRRGLANLAALTLSGLATARLSAEAEASFTATRADALRGMELSGGIDTDRELQDLLLIERAYGANARVVQTVDMMIKTLLEI
ncbi:MAG: flagellar hook-associated protein FlgK [Gemmobacter sp.]